VQKAAPASVHADEGMLGTPLWKFNLLVEIFQFTNSPFLLLRIRPLQRPQQRIEADERRSLLAFSNMPPKGLGRVAQNQPRQPGKGLDFCLTDHVHLAATFLAPGPDRSVTPDDQNSIGFNGDFDPLMSSHSGSPKLCPTPK
jgi:hypothetical protein